MKCRACGLWTLIVFLVFVANLFAEISPREAQRFCVDIILLKGGIELRGSVLKREEDSIQIAVQREWLKTRHPDMARQVEDAETLQTEQNQKQLKDRIAKWKAESPDKSRLAFTLDQQLRKLSDPVDLDMEKSQFVIVDLPTERVRRVFEASASSRLLGAAAWSDRLPKVEDTVLSKLKMEMEKTHPNWATERPDISDRLPTGQTQSEDEWAARQAIWEYDFVEAVNFQGTGNFVIRIEEGKRPDLAALFSQSSESLLAGQLKGLGLDLDLGGNQPATPKSDWRQKAIDEATKLGVRGFLVTRSPDITGQGPAIVASQFFARMSDGTNRVIWSDEVQTDPSTIKDADVKRIANDPQIQEVLKVAQALNVGNEIQKAVRFGGAVEASMNATASHFAEMRIRYTRTLAGPPLVLPTVTE